MKAGACGVPLSPNSPCLVTMKQMNKRQAYWHLRSRSSTSRKRRITLRRKRYQDYDSSRNESFYLKGQLDPK
jgi:hypothetical protein